MKDVKILMEDTSELEVQDLAAKLPSDLHLIHYEQFGEPRIDGVRAYKVVDIFDFYYDMLKEEGGSWAIHSIKSGYGRVKPRLYNEQTHD